MLCYVISNKHLITTLNNSGVTWWLTDGIVSVQFRPPGPMKKCRIKESTETEKQPTNLGHLAEGRVGLGAVVE